MGPSCTCSRAKASNVRGTVSFKAGEKLGEKLCGAQMWNCMIYAQSFILRNDCSHLFSFPDAGGLLRNSHSRAQELFVNTMLGMLGMFTGWSMPWICKTLVISVSILTNLTCLDLRRQKLSSKLNGTWPKEGQLSLGCLALCLCAVKVLPFAGSQSQFVHINDLGIDHVRLAALLGRG